AESRAWPAFVAPFVLAVVASVGFFVATFRLGRNVEGPGVYRGARIRVGAEGLSEYLQIIILAASVSAILLAGVAIMTAISALRHVSKPRWVGSALVALITGAVLSGIALIARLRLMSALGV